LNAQNKNKRKKGAMNKEKKREIHHPLGEGALRARIFGKKEEKEGRKNPALPVSSVGERKKRKEHFVDQKGGKEGKEKRKKKGGGRRASSVQKREKPGVLPSQFRVRRPSKKRKRKYESSIGKKEEKEEEKM